MDSLQLVDLVICIVNILLKILDLVPKIFGKRKREPRKRNDCCCKQNKPVTVVAVFVPVAGSDVIDSQPCQTIVAMLVLEDRQRV